MSQNDQEKSNYKVSEDIVENLGKLGLTVPVWEREITHEEIQYFLDRWPFLQLLSTNVLDSFEEVQLLVARKSNWTIINYGDAMASSPGAFLFGGGDYRIKLNRDEDDDDGDGGGLVNPDKGTVWRQAYNTAEEMVALARQLGWDGIHVVDGNPLMKWAVWMHAKDDKLPLSGFSPTERDQQRRERVKRSDIEDARLFTRQASRL